MLLFLTWRGSQTVVFHLVGREREFGHTATRVATNTSSHRTGAVLCFRDGAPFTNSSFLALVSFGSLSRFSGVFLEDFFPSAIGTSYVLRTGGLGGLGGGGKAVGNQRLGGIAGMPAGLVVDEGPICAGQGACGRTGPATDGGDAPPAVDTTRVAFWSTPHWSRRSGSKAG